MNNFKKVILSFGIIIFILINFELYAQEVSDSTQKGFFHTALSFSEFNNDNARANTGLLLGIQIGYSKEIFKEVSGRISTSYNFSNYKKRDYKAYMFDAGPQIEWYPTIKGQKWLWFGGGFRYRYVSATNRENDNFESYQGIGFLINFGWDTRIKNTNSYFYIDTEYDQINSEEDVQIGFLKINVGIKY